MKENFEQALRYVLHVEGGYVNDPDDPGGETNLGVTQGTLNMARKVISGLPKSVKSLSEEQAKQIYYQLYWKPVGSDDLPSGLDYVMFDIAVHHGVGGAKSIWRNYMGDTKLTQNSDIPYIIRKVLEGRLHRLRGLPHAKKYIRGWTNRVNFVRSKALEMVD